MSLGIPEIVLLLIFALVLFGAKRLPELGHGSGQGVREFKTGAKSMSSDGKDALHEEPADHVLGKQCAPRRKLPVRLPREISLRSPGRLDHLEELPWRIICSNFDWLVGTAAAYYFRGELPELLRAPLDR